MLRNHTIPRPAWPRAGRHVLLLLAMFSLAALLAACATSAPAPESSGTQAAAQGTAPPAHEALDQPPGAASSSPAQPPAQPMLDIVTTSNILADWVRVIGEDRVRVFSLVPYNGDPHIYHPKPSDVARASNADLLLAVGLTLESGWLDDLLRRVAPDPSRVVYVGDLITPIPFEGDAHHEMPPGQDDILYLGFSLEEVPRGVLQEDEVALTLTGYQGPGDFIMYTLDVFGEPKVHFNSRDGLSEEDRITYRAGAHSHVNWVFTQPGIYLITLEASAELRESGGAVISHAAEFTFEVNDTTPLLLGDGHVDLRVGLADGELRLSIMDGSREVRYAPDQMVLQVRPAALVRIPDDPRFQFTGALGRSVWLLPQGFEMATHEHGPDDPHFWFDPLTVKDAIWQLALLLGAHDPEGQEIYQANTLTYQRDLDDLHLWIAQQVEQVPPDSRLMVTTHHSFGYFAHRYGFEVIGSVIPGLSTEREPSPQQLGDLVNEIRSRNARAVFSETVVNESLARAVAEEAQVKIVTGLHTDSLGPPGSGSNSYLTMMRSTVGKIVEALK
jgi:surface-anchored protein